MRKVGLAAGIGVLGLAVALTVASPGVAQTGASPNGGAYGTCPGQSMMSWGMGPGMMYGYPGGYSGMMGPGIMYGYPRADNQSEPLNLSVSDVRTHFAHMLDVQGNRHVKVGTVVEKGANKIAVDIVTTDGSLVQRFEVDRDTGLVRREE